MNISDDETFSYTCNTSLLWNIMVGKVLLRKVLINFIYPVVTKSKWVLAATSFYFVCAIDMPRYSSYHDVMKQQNMQKHTHNPIAKGNRNSHTNVGYISPWPECNQR